MLDLPSTMATKGDKGLFVEVAAYDATKSYRKDSLVFLAGSPGRKWLALQRVPPANPPAENAYWTAWLDVQSAVDANTAAAASASAAAASATATAADRVQTGQDRTAVANNAAAAAASAAAAQASAEPAYSMFPDAFFRNSANIGQSLVVGGVDLLPSDSVKTWVGDYVHGAGKGAFKIPGTGGLGKFRVMFSATGARVGGVTTGSTLNAMFLAVIPAGLAVTVAARFIDASGAYVGGQVGTKSGQTGTGATGGQVIDMTALTVPAGAAGLEVWAYSSATSFYVLDFDVTMGATSGGIARLRAAWAGALFKTADRAITADGKASIVAAVVDTVSGTLSDVSAITATSVNSRTEAAGFTGFGVSIATPGSLSRNAVYISVLPRGAYTNASKRWTRIRVVVRTHATNAAGSGATLVAVGESRINIESNMISSLVVLLRDPATGDLKTITQADLLAQYFVGYEVLTDSGSHAYCGDPLGTINTMDGTFAASYYITSQDAQTGVWSAYGGAPVLGIGLCTVTTPVQSTGYQLLPSFISALPIYAPPRRNVQLLRRYRSGVAQIKGGVATRIVLAMIGDSTTAGFGYYIQGLAKRLVAEYGDGGVGWFGLGASFGNRDARGLYYVVTSSGTFTNNNHNGSSSADISDVRTSTANATITVANTSGATHPALSAVKLHMEQTADSVISWSWDGGATWASNVNVQGTPGNLQIVDLTGFPTSALSSAATGTISLIIKFVSGSHIAKGIEFRSASNGIVIHKLGSSGSKYSDWLLANAAQWQAAIAALAPTTAQILLGINDQAASVPAATFGANAAALCDRLRSAVPGIDLLLVSPYESPLGRAIVMPDYASALIGVAESKSAAFVDLQQVFGKAANTAEYAYAGTVPMLVSDNTHPNTLGGYAIGQELFSVYAY